MKAILRVFVRAISVFNIIAFTVTFRRCGRIMQKSRISVGQSVILIMTVEFGINSVNGVPLI